MPRIIMVGDESWQSFKILNPNAFPQDSSFVKASVMACADKLALIHYSVQLIEREINNDLTRFVSELNSGKGFKDFTPDHQRDLVVIYHNMSFQAGLQSFFICTKSMLDIYAQIASKLIEPQSTLFGFNKGNFRGKKLVGGTLLNWIEHNAPVSYPQKKQLIEILLAHIDNWIADVVRHRDQIVHNGRLDDLIEMCVLLSKQPQQIKKDEIILPTIRSKGDLLEYCKQVLVNIYRMLRETLILFPNVDTKLIDL